MQRSMESGSRRVLSSRFAVALLLGASATFLPVERASAGHGEPAAGKKASFALVNGFLPCFTPNTATQSGSLSACAPPIPTVNCAMSPSGKGKLTVAVTGNLAEGTQDILLTAAATGLNCEGQSLHIRLSFTATSDDCPEGACTTIDHDDFDLVGASAGKRGSAAKRSAADGKRTPKHDAKSSKKRTRKRRR